MSEQLLENGERSARRRIGRRCSDHGGCDPEVLRGAHRSRIHGYTVTGLSYVVVQYRIWRLEN